jgi:general stress protein YciG
VKQMPQIQIPTQSIQTNTTSSLRKRGFASMDPQRQREIASEGGRAAHEKGTAHEWTSEEAREAGRKGGMRKSQNRMTKTASVQG